MDSIYHTESTRTQPIVRNHTGILENPIHQSQTDMIMNSKRYLGRKRSSIPGSESFSSLDQSTSVCLPMLPMYRPMPVQSPIPHELIEKLSPFVLDSDNDYPITVLRNSGAISDYIQEETNKHGIDSGISNTSHDTYSLSDTGPCFIGYKKQQITTKMVDHSALECPSQECIDEGCSGSSGINKRDSRTSSSNSSSLSLTVQQRDVSSSESVSTDDDEEAVIRLNTLRHTGASNRKSNLKQSIKHPESGIRNVAKQLVNCMTHLYCSLIIAVWLTLLIRGTTEKTGDQLFPQQILLSVLCAISLLWLLTTMIRSLNGQYAKNHSIRTHRVGMTNKCLCITIRLLCPDRLDYRRPAVIPRTQATSSSPLMSLCERPSTTVHFAGVISVWLFRFYFLAVGIGIMYFESQTSRAMATTFTRNVVRPLSVSYQAVLLIYLLVQQLVSKKTTKLFLHSGHVHLFLTTMLLWSQNVLGFIFCSSLTGPLISAVKNGTICRLNGISSSSLNSVQKETSELYAYSCSSQFYLISLCLLWYNIKTVNNNGLCSNDERGDYSNSTHRIVHWDAASQQEASINPAPVSAQALHTNLLSTIRSVCRGAPYWLLFASFAGALWTSLCISLIVYIHLKADHVKENLWIYFSSGAVQHVFSLFLICCLLFIFLRPNCFSSHKLGQLDRELRSTWQLLIHISFTGSMFYHVTILTGYFLEPRIDFGALVVDVFAMVGVIGQYTISSLISTDQQWFVKFNSGWIKFCLAILSFVNVSVVIWHFSLQCLIVQYYADIMLPFTFLFRTILAILYLDHFH